MLSLTQRLTLAGFFLLLPVFGYTQDDVGRKVHWANTVRYSQPFSGGTNIEPEANGARAVINQRLETELEARFSPHFSAYLLVSFDLLRTWTEPKAGQDAFLPNPDDPFAVAHPYRSRLTTGTLQLGGQYNWRISVHGEFSLGVAVGVGSAGYQRSYDFIGREQIFIGTATDSSDPTLFFVLTPRVQYTQWFNRQFAVTAGVMYVQSSYLSGGVESAQGTRYAINTQESAALSVFYNHNYDRSNQTPDPTISINRLNFFLGLSSRF